MGKLLDLIRPSLLKQRAEIARRVADITAAHERCWQPHAFDDCTMSNCFEAHRFQQSRIMDIGPTWEQRWIS
ncbi:hypothetical protein Q8F57_009650 [Paraburkholderia terrae]|uniref:hypothetical protein n=1 Tax=Paraburkholderia terrae TaxID=311230 RepID=UPI00296B2F7B|nr:hypothetical protein [Paraburkholderia terrae]MDW3662557.1 hypothetical protein [Paraburkholderia terrae]